MTSTQYEWSKPLITLFFVIRLVIKLQSICNWHTLLIDLVFKICTIYPILLIVYAAIDKLKEYRANHKRVLQQK